MEPIRRVSMVAQAGGVSMSTENTCITPDEKPDGPCTSGLFTLYTIKDFQSMPEMTWLIDDILPSSGLASVYGPSGVGKSFVCLDMAASVASGAHWFGHPTIQSTAVYIVLEGRAGFRRRAIAWAIQRGVPFPENVKFVFDEFAFNNPDHTRELGKLIKRCGGAGLIIIDTLNKAAPGTDENSSSDMGRIIAGASALQESTGGLVLLIHHPGKDASRGLRGHSSLHAVLDTVIETERVGEHIRWKLVKSKDGEDGISHAFRLEVVELGNDESGKTIKSCVVQAVEGAVTYKKPSEPRGANQQIILTAVRNILIERRMQNVMEVPGWPEGIPFDEVLSEIKDVLEDVDLKHRQLRAREALEGLIRQGYLSVSGDLLCLPI